MAAQATEAITILTERCDEFERWRHDVAECCFRLDTPAALPLARKWIRDSDRRVRFWAALVLLMHGDRSKSEGLATLRPILDEDDGSWYFPLAFDVLVEVGTEEAFALACGVVKKRGFSPRYDDGYILYRLFRLGREESLAYIVAGLDDDTPCGTSYGTRQGEEVEREQVLADEVAGAVSSWKKNGSEYDTLAPPEERKRQREALKRWVKAQFELIKAGRETDVVERLATPTSYPSTGRWRHMPEGRIDAP